MKMKIKQFLPKYLFYIFLFIIAYFGLYFFLSCIGSYMPSQSGKIRYTGGISMTDIEIWQPKFITFKTYYSVDGSKSIKANIGGYLFYPLILIDRNTVHKTVSYFEETDSSRKTLK